MLGQRFHSMFSSLGWTSGDVAKFLQVSVRTVQLWVSGRVRVPYAAYKLLRLQLRYELPGDAWNGWTISAGRLYTPEGHELRPQDFNWWSLLARRSALFHELYAENVRLTQQMKAGRMLPGTAGDGKRSADPAGRGCTAPTSAAGRPAAPAGLIYSYLTLEHGHPYFFGGNGTWANQQSAGRLQLGGTGVTPESSMGRPLMRSRAVGPSILRR